MNDNLEDLSDQILNELFDSEVTGLERKEIEYVDIDSRSISIYPPTDYCKNFNSVIPYLEKWKEGDESRRINILYWTSWEIEFRENMDNIVSNFCEKSLARTAVIALIKAKRKEKY